MNYWIPWERSDDEVWDVKRVVHLHRRAGFAATWKEIQRDAQDGAHVAISRLLAGQSRLDGVPSDFDQISDILGASAEGSHSAIRLQAWWMYRLLFSPDPLTEKLTLLWHNHFATSNLKVDDLGKMHRQNTTLRQLAKAPFGKLLNAMLRDPALLTWLDAPANKKGSPNENLARELMELFTLGIGNYTEDDVKQAARALTGWTVKRGEHTFDENEHDAGAKTILGKTGMWKPTDFIAILLAHPATARRLAWRLCDLLMGENVATPEVIDSLAIGLRDHDLDINWAVETVLRSQRFFSEANIASRVSSPVEFIVNSIRAVEAYSPPPSTLSLTEWSTGMGQDLFYPPNVGGWTGGRDWLGSRNVVARANFAAALVQGKLNATPTVPRLKQLAHDHVGATDLASCVEFFGQAVSGRKDDGLARELLAIVENSHEHKKSLELAIALMLARPEFQLV